MVTVIQWIRWVRRVRAHASGRGRTLRRSPSVDHLAQARHPNLIERLRHIEHALKQGNAG
jgi:hypothetical protein